MNNSSSQTLTATLPKRDLTWPKVTLGLYFLTLILGFLGNVTVLLIILSKKVTLRRPHELFILNLAVCDLLLIALFLPFQIYIFLEPFNPSFFYCKFVATLITIALGAGIFTLTAMAVHRWQVIVHPFKPAISRNTVLIWLLIVWILSFALGVPKMVVSTARSGRCVQQWPSIGHKKIYILSSFISRFVIPLLIITYAYFQIAKDLARSPPAPRFVLDEEGQIRNYTARQENIEVVRTLAVIVLLFVLCMLPSRLATIVMLFGNEQQAALARHFRKYTSVLTIAHSSLNPIAYGTLTKHFRSSLVRGVCWLNPWFKRRHAIRAKNRKVSGNLIEEMNPPSKCRRNMNLNHLSLENGLHVAEDNYSDEIKEGLLESRKITRNGGRKETAV